MTEPVVSNRHVSRFAGGALVSAVQVPVRLWLTSATWSSDGLTCVASLHSPPHAAIGSEDVTKSTPCRAVFELTCSFMRLPPPFWHRHSCSEAFAIASAHG